MDDNDEVWKIYAGRGHPASGHSLVLIMCNLSSLLHFLQRIETASPDLVC